MEKLIPLYFFVGFVLLVIEMFAPGFGLAGAVGIILIAIGIIKVSSSLLMAVLLLILLVLFAVAFFWFLYRSASKGLIGKKIVLDDALSDKEGYTSGADLSEMLGKTGVAITALRPAGIANIDGKRVDVQSGGEYVPNGEKIIVMRTEGSKLIVKREE